MKSSVLLTFLCKKPLGDSVTSEQNELTFSEFTLTLRFENLAFRFKLPFIFGDNKNNY